MKKRTLPRWPFGGPLCAETRVQCADGSVGGDGADRRQLLQKTISADSFKIKTQWPPGSVALFRFP